MAESPFDAAFDRRLISRVLRKHGDRLLDHALHRLFPTEAAAVAPKKPGFGGRIARAALMKVATRSVPGAIIVGGGLLAKHLHDRRKAARAVASDTVEAKPTSSAETQSGS